MRYNKIRTMDISNGEGVRVSLFVQGCNFHCKGCFNSEAWDFQGGKEFTDETLRTLLDLCDKDYIEGLSILGGEPMHPANRETVVDIMRAFKFRFPNKNIWMWTGYTIEYLLEEQQHDGDIQSMLIYLDYLVDGQFIEEKKNLKLKWAGSENQRLIDIQESMRQKQLITLPMLEADKND